MVGGIEKKFLTIVEKYGRMILNSWLKDKPSGIVKSTDFPD